MFSSIQKPAFTDTRISILHMQFMPFWVLFDWIMNTTTNHLSEKNLEASELLELSKAQMKSQKHKQYKAT